MSSDGFSASLLRATAALVADAGVAEYQPDGQPYGDDVVGIYFTAPQAGRAITLAYMGEQPLDHSSTRVTLQARIRTTSDPLDLDLLDDLRDALHGRGPFALGPVRVTSIVLLQTARLGLVSGALEWQQNYRVLCARFAEPQQ